MNEPVLFVNACVRRQSRTRFLAQQLLARLHRPVEEVDLGKVSFPAVDGAFLARRDRLIEQGDTDSPEFALSRQFARAETVVIAAPYWDLSFPAALKQYLEQINVVGLTFRYSPQGVPVGLCRASRLYYVTTAGGCFAPEEYGFGYVKALCQGYYGIQDVRKLQAVGLDLDGADVEAILQKSVDSIGDVIR